MCFPPRDHWISSRALKGDVFLNENRLVLGSVHGKIQIEKVHSTTPSKCRIGEFLISLRSWRRPALWAVLHVQSDLKVFGVQQQLCRLMMLTETQTND